MVLLLLLAVPVLLAVRGVRRAGAWSRRPRHPMWTVARLLPYLAPILVLVTLHRIAGILYRGRDISWLQTVYHYPTFVVLLAATAVACVVVLGVRVIRSVERTRRGRADARGAAPVPVER